MKLYQTSVLATFALLLPMLLTGCGSSPDSVMGEMIAKINELNDVLEKVDDKESAEAHKAEIESIANELNELTEEYEELEKDMSKEEKNEIEEKYRDDASEAFGDTIGHMFRMATSPYGAEIAKALQGIKRDKK